MACKLHFNKALKVKEIIKTVKGKVSLQRIFTLQIPFCFMPYAFGSTFLRQ